MLQPLGLLCIAVALAVPFVIWRLVLGKRVVVIGYAPLAVALTSSLLGLFLAKLWAVHGGIPHPIVLGSVSRPTEWGMAVNWATQSSMLALLSTLPTLGLVATPLASYFLRTGRLTLPLIGRVLFLIWIALALASWSFPATTWHVENRLASLQYYLTQSAICVCMVGAPYALLMYVCVRSRASIANG